MLVLQRFPLTMSHFHRDFEQAIAGEPLGTTQHQGFVCKEPLLNRACFP